MYDKLLVLDLDECLIHSSRRYIFPDPDYVAGPYTGVHRPHLSAFIKWARGNFRHLGIWTASTADYAQDVIDSFAPRDFFDFIWPHRRCSRGVYKDLKKLRRAGYSVERTIAVDDRTSPWKRSYGNLIQIPAYRGHEEDDWLPKLQEFLQLIGDCENVRAMDLDTRSGSASISS